MIPDTEIMARLERLERDNRRLKRLVTVALVVAAALGLMAATRPVPDVFKAHEFDVVDSSGKVRIRAAFDKYGHATIAFQDPKLGDALINTNGVNFYDSAGRPTVTLLNAENGGGLMFFGKRSQKIGKFSFPVSRMLLNDWGLKFNRRNGTNVIQLGGISEQGSNPVASMAIHGTSSSVKLSDSEGYEMDLGRTNTVTQSTGETHETSADSIIMFGNDKEHHVIWQAP